MSTLTPCRAFAGGAAVFPCCPAAPAKNLTTVDGYCASGACSTRRVASIAPDEDRGRSSPRNRRRHRPARRPPPAPAARPRPSAPGYSPALHGPPTGKNGPHARHKWNNRLLRTPKSAKDPLLAVSLVHTCLQDKGDEGTREVASQ